MIGNHNRLIHRNIITANFVLLICLTDVSLTGTTRCAWIQRSAGTQRKTCKKEQKHFSHYTRPQPIWTHVNAKYIYYF